MHSEYVACPLLSCKGWKSKQVCYFVCEWFRSGKCETIRYMWNGMGYEQPKRRKGSGTEGNGTTEKV
jgi:hypothetical protein